MDRRSAVKAAEEFVALLERMPGENAVIASWRLREGLRGALARMANQRLPSDAHVAVLGRHGGEPAFVAVDRDSGALYLLEPADLDASTEQRPSAKCRIVPIVHDHASVSTESRWSNHMGTELRVTDWTIKIGDEVLAFTTERYYDGSLPDDEAFAAVLCAAAGLPLGREADRPLAAAA